MVLHKPTRDTRVHSVLHVQWNPSIAATLGEHNFGRYIGLAFIEVLFCTQIVHLGPGFLAVVHYSGAAVKSGSTV